ncbi:MAG: MFS transporter [Chloroflexi bacterium]|nr:MFS transporter [Chloroflexota bacterium]
MRPPPLAGGIGLFASRDYTLLWAATLGSSGGLWMERIVTTWLTLEIGGAPAVGINLSMRLVPFLLLGMVAGTLADRFPRRSILAGVAIGSALAAALGAAWMAAAPPALPQLMLIALISGVANAFDMSARGALAVDLAGRENATSAIALNAVGGRLLAAVGSLGGGIVLAAIGAAAGYAIVAVAHAIALVILLRIASESIARHQSGVVPAGFMAMLRATLGLLARNPAVRMIFIASLACETFGFSHQAALPTLARDILAIGPEGLGALTAASSVGATLSVLGLSFLGPFIRRQPLLVTILALWGGTLLALAATGLVPMAMGLMLVVGACAAAVDVLQQTIAQMAVAESERGRAVGIWTFSIGMNVIGLNQVGYVVALFGAPASLALNGVGAIASALLIAALNPTFRWRTTA